MVLLSALNALLDSSTANDEFFSSHCCSLVTGLRQLNQWRHNQKYIVCSTISVCDDLQGFRKMQWLEQGFSNGALGPLGATERFSGVHEQWPSLGSSAVILHYPSVTIVLAS